jgi:hypothetical protein
MSAISGIPSLSSYQATTTSAALSLFNQSGTASDGITPLSGQLNLLESSNEATILEAGNLDSSNSSTSPDMNNITSAYDSLNSQPYVLSDSLQNLINNNTSTFNVENGVTQLSSGVFGTNPSILANLPILQSDTSTGGTTVPFTTMAAQTPLDMTSIITNYNNIEKQVTIPIVGSNVSISA